MNPVERCPTNEAEVNERIKVFPFPCGKDEHEHHQYMCLPNIEKTSLVEFCYNNTLGIQLEGM